MRRGYIKRDICIDVMTEEEMIEVLERLSERLNYVDFKAESRPGRIRVIFYGPKDLIRDAMAEAYEIARAVRGMMYPDSNGLYAYSIREVVSLVRGVAIPLNLLVYSLRFKGFEAYLDRGYVKTNAKLEDVMSAAASISDVYEEMKFTNATPMCKRLIALYSTVMDINVVEAIADLEDMKLIRRDGEEGPYILSTEFNQAIAKLKEMVGEGHEDPDN
ncbi:MAG: DUF2067 family protein [Thermoprotei archaeon]|nr:DUF2067 family protein [Thermoprotei archaeon]